MSKNADRIRNALEAKGYAVEEIAWEPIGSAVEMGGPSGGWYVAITEPSNETILGYNIQEVMEQINELPVW